MSGLGTVLLGALFFFPILYYIVSGAVEDGTLKALMEYERLKNQKNRNE